jgi:NADH:ubiquinone oxidoreductase subunit K
VSDLNAGAVLGLSAVLLGVGLFGILTRRNFILLLIAIEIAMNAAILNFVAFGAFLGNGGGTVGLSGQAIAVVLVGLAATEVAVGLAIVLALNRLKGSINVGEATSLKL